MIILLLIGFGAISSCLRESKPARPSNVPKDAKWAGGVDGGGWVTCTSSNENFNVCTTYGEDGATFGPRRFILEHLGRAATADELRYTYLAEPYIGLENGKQLIEIRGDPAAK
jgi:hypothetical protein